MNSYLLLGRMKTKLQNSFFFSGTFTHLLDLFSDGQHNQPESRGDGSEAQHSVRVLGHGHERQENQHMEHDGSRDDVRSQ